MAGSGRRALFWKLNAATGYSMAAGAGAWAANEPMATALGPVAGTLVWVAVFAGVSVLVSMVTFGSLLRDYDVTPAADRGGSR